MKKLAGDIIYDIENQSFIDLMYKGLVLVFSLSLLLPLRWLPFPLLKRSEMTIPIIPTALLLVTCGELVLNNPTVSPAGPYCPGATITFSFTGTNLPEGDNLNVYWGTSSSFNPFSGGGTLIGSVPIDYTCSSPCPTIMGVMVNPATCSGADPNDEQNEFMVLGSGCGFNVNNFQLNPSVGGAGVNDSIGGSQGCTWSLASAQTAVSNLLANGTDCAGNIFAAGPGTNIPGGAIVLVFNDNTGPLVPFNFQALCDTGMPIYVLNSSCDRILGAYSNVAASTPSYTLSGCSSGNTFSYTVPPNPANAGLNNILALGGSSFVSSASCADPGLTGINFPNIPIATASVNYTIPAGLCTGGTTTYYVSGMINQNVPCLNTVYTPPSSLPLTINCVPVITPAGPFCNSASPVTLTVSPTGGTWSGPGVNPVTGVFTPSAANIGNNTITFTSTTCGSSTSITIVVNCCMTIDPNALFPVQTTCNGGNDGNIVFDDGSGIIGGVGPYTLDWDLIGTPANDVFSDDGLNYIDSIPAGTYAIIVTDAMGCTGSATVVVENAPPIVITTQLTNVKCNGGTTGGIQITSISGPPGNIVYDWDWGGTPFNDDYGGPPATNDPEDLITGLAAGTYYLTVTISDDPTFPTYTCIYTATFVLTEPTALVATGPDVALPCFGNTTTITATASGGTSPYTYNWSNIPGVNNPATNGPIGAGNYVITITDANGCTSSDIAAITQPASALTASAVGETVACNNNMGDITLTVSGGTAAYTYVWSNGMFTQNLSGLNGGTYTVTVTDNNGCTTTAQATITVTPPTFTMPANAGSTVPCISNAQVVPANPAVNNSCGTPLTTTGPVVSANPACSGTKTYTWTYTDPTTSIMATWVYTYTITAPTFVMPAAGGSTVACIANALVTPTPPVISNSCGTALTISGPVVGASPACSGTKTYTWTYTDCTGTSSPWVYTYTISPPTFTMPAAGASTVACIANAQVVPANPVINNSCGTPMTFTGPVVGANPVCSGTKTYTWTYTDCTGLTAPWVYTYTISPPTFVMPAAGASTVTCISNAQVVPANPVVNNSCGTPLTFTGPVVGADPVCSGTKTYTWTYTDCTGTSSPWVYTYTISAPTFTLPANGASTVPCISNAQTVPTPPSVTNSCGNPITPTGPVIGADPVCSGTKTYTWTYTDCSGSSLNWIYTYTISPPTFSLPAAGASTVPCIINAQTVPTPPVVTNSCGATITPTGPVVSANPACSGPKTYTWTYTDCTGTSAQWVYTYTISAPTFSLPAAGGSTVPCIINAQTVPTPPVVTNSCGTTITPTGPVIGANPACSGTKTYTWTYTDCTGSSLPWVYTYTISAPTFSVPAAGGSTVPCIINAQTVPTPPVVTNSCGTAISPTGPVVGANPACSGTKTYTWTYTDCTGSSLPWVYTYTISAPTFTMPAAGASTVACIANALVVPANPVINNSCGTPMTFTGPVVGASPVCSGTKTYTWTYTDCTGLSAPWVYTYTISPPTFVMPAAGASTVACISNAQVVPANPVVNNSCGTPLTFTGPVVGADPVCSGTKTYTWTYTDCTGTSSPWVYTYTISPPTFTLPANGASTVPCISNAQTVPTPPVVTNSCGSPITPTGPVIGPDPVCSGIKTYTWTYTDCSGSSSNWIYTYTISPPTFTLPAPGSSTVPCISNAQTVPTPPVVTNSCGSTITPTGPVVGANPACSGLKTYTWTYTDCTGTSAQWVYTYTISAPTFSVPAAGGSTVGCVILAQTVPTPPVVTNSCGTTITPTGPVVGPDPVCAGTKTYTWTYTDCTGTALPWVYTYTVTAPTVVVPGPGGSTVACISNAQVVPTPPVVNNSCGTLVVPTGPVVSADPVCSGTKTYTWTYNGCAGGPVNWVYTYTISPPTYTMPAAGASTVPCISNAQTVPTPPVVNNSCGTPLTITGPVVGANPVCSGTKTYTWTYTDCTGTSSPWVYTYTISPPTFTMPAPGASTVACISNAQVVPANPVVNNSCGTPMTFTGPVVGANPVCSGTKTYTWTYTDCTGSSAPWVYTYTISPPTFTLPANSASTVPCISNAQTVPTPPVVTNSCGSPITPTGPVIGADPVCSGTKTYTWTYTDCTGSSLSWIYTYTISPPTFTLPAPGSSTVPCIVNAQTVPTPPVVTNSCGSTITPTGPVIGADPACSGPKTYTWTYTDCTGTSSQWVYTYTVSPPTFSVPAAGGSTVGCVSLAQTVPTPPVVTNSCGTTITPTGPVVGPDPVCAGTKTYTWTYTDCTGTALPWVYTYTVTAPTVVVPGPGGSTVACISNAQVVPTPPVVNNSCGTLVVPTGPVVSADPVCSGTKTYTWTYNGCAGGPVNWVYTYTISPPTFTMPAPGASTVPCISNALTVPTPPVVNNSCGTPLTITGPVVGANPVCSGTKTYTWTYTDCTGTSSPWVYTYTISPPTFTMPAPGASTVPCRSNAQVVPTPPVVNNSCGTPMTITGPVVGPDPVCSGTKTYTWTYTDCTGSSSPWVYTYTISPPTFTLPANGASTVPCISNAQTVPTPPVVTNSCGSPITPTGPVIGADPVCSGTKIYTWTYTDCTGSSLSWIYTYTISPPTFTLPAPGSSTVPCIVNAQTVPTPPVVTNSCGSPITPTGPVVGANPACSGTKTYTWTYTDCTGTSTQWVYTYTISAPTFSLPAPGGSTVACVIDAQVPPSPPVVNNSCGTAITPTGPVIGPDPVCGGTKTFTWTYTDCTGTTAQWVYTFTINVPTLTLPANGSSTVACISNAQTVPTPPTVNNSCGDPVIPTGPVVGADPVCSGTKTYTWTYNGCAGGPVNWVYTYTISPPTFTMPAPGASTVPCISNAQTVPTPPVVNNSCGTPMTITGPVVGANPVCSGTKTYTWTYTDCTGSSSPWVYTYTISPPTFALPANGGSTVACVSNAQTVPTPPVVNNSCGTPMTITGPVVGPDPVCSGTKTYTWTYTDCTGSSGQWIYTYTVSPPTATMPANGASTVTCIINAQTVPTPPVVNNSCGTPLAITGPVVGPDPVCSGTKTYTWTYTDCTGTTSNWIYTYTVSPPTFTLPANGASTVACISNAQTTPTPPVVNNSCGTPISPTGPVISPDPVCSGTKTYTWTYTDCTGSSLSWIYTYTISPPTFSLPAPGGSTVACIINAQTVPTPPVVTNSCGTPITPTGPVVGPDPVCSGTKTYTWTYTDCTGTSSQWVYTYTINPPTITLPANGGSTVACISNAQVVPTPPVVNNSCGTPVIPTGPVVGADPVCSGTKTYTWTYNDCAGGSVNWVYTYTINAPTFTMPAAGGSTVPCISNAQTVPTPPAVNNSCGTPLTITGPVVGANPVCSGTKTYTWTYTDCTGTSSPWVYTYTISPPTFALPANGGSTVACVSNAQTVPTPPVVNNSCGTPMTITGPVVGPDPVCSGTKTYTWTYTDCTGSSGQWIYTYTVSPPTATMPANGASTVACIINAQTVPTPPVVNNSCGTPLAITGPVVGPDPVCSGTKTYTWTYTDCTGTTSNWIYTYTVSPPTFTLPANGASTVACISNAQTTPTPPVVNNSCGTPISPTGPVIGPDPVCSGTKTYTWTYTDCTGSSLSWIYTYTISPPTFSLPAPGGSTVACIIDAQTVPTPPVVTNSCGTPITPTGPVVGPDPVCSGTKTYTWTYTDCTGTSSQWVYTYTINAPTFTLPAPGGSTVACISNAQVVPTPPVVNNSCGAPVIPTGPVVGADPVCSGTKTYTWTYLDCSGSSALWVYTYTISPPTFSLPAAGGSTVPCISNAQTVPTPPVVNNSCGTPLTITGPVVGPNPVCSGTKTYTWTYTDCTGSSGQWVYTYTVSPPTFTLPAPGGSTVACVSDAQVVPTPPVVTNSCGNPIAPTGPVIGPDPVCSGTKTYTWTYTDCTGTSAQWVYTYTVSPPTSSLPANGGSTVACISNAQVVPTPPSVNNSCGNPLTVTGPVVGPDPVCSGTKTYTWTYTDCTGSSAQWVYTYTVSPPTFALPAAGASTVACISNAQTVPTPPVVNNSCGAPLTITGPVVGPNPVCSGTKTYTWTYTDCTGNSAPWVYTYTISPPTFSLPANGSSTVPCISDAQVVPAPPVVNNSCGTPLTITGPVIGPDPVCSGTKTYTWTYTDCTGTSGQWVYTYTVPAPTFTVPAPGGSTVACISNAQVVPTPPIVDNSCGDPVTPSGPVIGPDPVCSGTKTYTWTYLDCSGSTLPWVYTYTISPPTFTLPAPGGSTVACVSNAQVVPAPPVVTNSCGSPIAPTGPVIGPDPVCSGTKTYTWTYTDCTGTSSQWVYTYTVSPPTFTLPAPGGSTVACVSDAQVVPTPPVVTNSCGNPIAPTGPVIGPDPVCSGTKTYTWTYTDCTGTSAQWVYTYTVSPPTSSLPANGGSTVACISNAQVVPTPPSVNNSCGNPLTVTGPVVGPDPVCSGTKTYTWTYTDCTGSSAQWIYTYTVSPPTLALPANGSSTVSCIINAQTIPTPPAVNNSCGTPITPTGPVVGPDPVCSGTKTYTWTYTDCTGSSSQWIYTYTISPPTFALPANGGSTVPCISDAQVVPTPPVVNNSCGAPMTITGPVIGPDPVCSGTKTFTWTYTDCTGNSGQWVYTYTITAPTFILPANGGSNVACVSDAQVVPVPPVVDNSCGDPVTPTGPVVGPDPACAGTKTYTWTYTDCTGSSSQWIYTYTIPAPTITLPANGGSTVACVIDAQVVPTPPTVNNSCGAPVIPTGPVIGPDPVCSGTKTYTWTYTDCAGGTSQWVYTYTITPSTSVMPANGSSTVACISDAQVVPTPPVVNNSCGIPLAVTGPVIGADPVCSGTKTYTWTYTDCAGNASPWVYTYTINAPTFSLPADGGSTVACISNAQTVPTPPVVTNSCGSPITPTGPVIGADPVCSGTKTYTWTYTDCTGSSLQWVYTYTITPPTSSLPSDGGSTVACISNAQIVPIPPAATNSCGAPLTVTGPVISADPVCSGTKTYVWTYTDCTGNSAQWTYTYTINPPTFTLPAAGGSTVACISNAQVVPTPPVVNNSCGTNLTITGPVIGPDPVCSGTKTYTWTYTDCTGNSSPWVYTYTISPPNITLPPNDGSTVTCVGDAQVVPVPPVVSSSCGDPITPTGPVISADPACSGTKTYTWTYTDCNGGSAQWVYTYTINTPAFTLPPNDGSTVACIIDAQVVPTPPVVNNACSNPVIPTGPVISPDPVCAGTKTYTWTYTDCNGGSVDWVYTYTINAPTIVLPPDGGSTVTCISDAQVVPTPPTVNNSCGIPVIPTGPVVSADPACSGPKTYTWTYLDCAGGNTDWVYTYTIIGNTGPVFAAPPADVTVSCVGDVPPMITLTYTDDCTPSGSVSGIDSPMTGNCPATIIRTWTFTDNCGFTDSKTQTITIHDTTPPTASDPAPLTLAGCNLPVPVPDATVVTDEADNCTPAPVVAFVNDVTSSVGCTETTIRTFSVTDACGNSILVTQTITRTLDNTPPLISGAPADITVACLSQVPPMPSLTYTDNCSPGGTIIGTETGPSGMPLTIIRTWTITDACGNPASVTQTITINNIIPVTNLTGSFCIGGSYLLPDGNSTFVGGNFGPFTFVAANGCDSLVNVTLTVNQSTTGNVNHNGCAGDGYTVVVNGTTYNEFNPTGTETLTGANANGCDSIVTINLVFNANVTGQENYSGCQGDGYSVVVNGTLYNEANPNGTETLTSSTGCDSVVTINLVFANNTPASITPVSPVCTASGIITLNASPGGGTWSGEVTSDQLNPAALGVGTHQIIYTISQGACSSADTIDVVIYDLSVVCQALTDESAPGANDGEGQVTVTGGIPPYNIQWTGPVSGSVILNADGSFTITSLGGGVYTIQVQDASANGCITTCQFVINSNIPCTVVIDNINVQDASCTGANNGAISVSASGGMIPYEYSLDGINFQPLNVFANLSPGNYTVFVRDITGCVVPQNFTIGIGPGPSLVIDDNTNASCGIANGSVTVHGINGSLPYTYSIDGTNYSQSGVFPGLNAGNYLVYLTDNVGCSDTIPVTVVADGAPVINNVVIVDAACGQSNGSITIQASGGQGILMYSINGGANFQASNVFNGRPAGTYAIVVKDETGCQVTDNATILNSNGPAINSVVVVPATCGNSDGKITITATGAPPLSYSINGSNYFANDIFTGLAAGTYTVYVKDGNNCVQSQPVTVNNTNGPQINGVVVKDTKCGDDVGSITVNATGGVGQLEYFFNGLSNGNDNSVTGLPAGDYDIVVSDDNGCSATDQVTIAPSVKPDFDVYITPAHCGRADGVIELDGTDGKPPFLYSFNGGPFGPIFTFPGHASDFYTVAIKDANGCITEKDVFLFEDVAPDISAVDITGVSCGMADGIIEVTATGIAPLMYSIAVPFYQASNIFSPVAAGTYTVTVKDNFGCTATATAVIAPKPQPAINNVVVVNTQCGTSSGMLTVQANGGVAPLMYALNNGSFVASNIFSGLAAGTYTVKVKGANGCEVTQDVTVISIGAHVSSLSASFCSGGFFQIGVNTYSLPGAYTVTLLGGASNGCDSIINLTLSLNQLIPKTLPVNICAGDVYTINGNNYSVAGQYLIDTIPALIGCDTIRTLNLTVNPLKTKTINASICANQVYTINGNNYSVAGQYLIDTIPALIGCDTIRTLNLTVNPLEASTLNVSICNGELFTYNGNNYGVSGQYVVDTLPAAVGCDSILTLNLVVSNYISSTVNSSICSGDTLTINGIDFTATGQYLLDTIVNPNSCDTIRTLNLTVDPLPLADAGTDQELNCNSQSVILNGTATGGTPQWTGPDINAGNQNLLTPTVTLPGVYYLTVTSPNNCAAIDSAVVTLDPSTVVATASVDTFLSCNIDTVVLQAGPLGPNLIYQWTGPGINASNEHLVNPIVTVAGVYTVVVTNTVTNCVSLPVNVTVLDLTTNIVAIIQDPNSLTCFSTFVDLDATGSSVGPNIQYIWFDDQGNIVSTSPFLQVSSGGMFMFVVKDTISGCFDNDSVFVEDLQAYPPVTAGNPQQLDCNHSVVTLNAGATNSLPNVIFHWDGPPGGILTNPDLLAIMAGTGGEYILTASDTVTGCSNSDSVMVTDLSQLPFAEIQLVERFTCLDNTALINIGSSETGPNIVYEWNGPLTNGVHATSIETTEPGMYYLTVSNQATGCASMDSIQLDLPNLLVGVQANISNPLCKGDSSGILQVNSVTGGTPVYTYSIDGITDQTSPLFDSLAAGSYILQVTDANGCTYEETLTIPEGIPLNINIGADIELELGDSIQLSANVNLPWSQIDSIVWSSGIHLSCTHCIDPTLYGLLNEIISASAYAGNCADTDKISIRVNVDANVYIPNVFSPNHDGTNDYVTVFADSRVKRVVYLEIFDRWGNQVFVANDFLPNDPQLGWDGTFKSKLMNPAVFAYVAQVELINGVLLPFKGDITLLR